MRATVFDAGTQAGARVAFTESRVRSVVTHERANEPGEAVVVLDNGDGALDDAGTGTVRALRPGAQLGLAFGYRTTSGRELVYRQAYWVSRVEHGRDGRRRVVTVEARDAMGELAALRVRRDYQVSSALLLDALQRGVARVTASTLTATSGAVLSTTLEPWRVPAGTKWSAELARLARAGGGLLRWSNASANGVGWSACVVEWLDYGGGASVWSVGGASGSPFVQGRWWSASPAFTSAEVEGTGFLGESRDWAAIWDEWRDVVAVVSDRRLGSQTEVDDRATAEARMIAGSSWGGVARVGLVPGLEVGDVVTVTDELGGVAAVDGYVRGIVTRFELEKGKAEQDVTVEGLS